VFEIIIIIITFRHHHRLQYRPTAETAAVAFISITWAPTNLSPTLRQIHGRGGTREGDNQSLTPRDVTTGDCPSTATSWASIAHRSPLISCALIKWDRTHHTSTPPPRTESDASEWNGYSISVGIGMSDRWTWVVLACFLSCFLSFFLSVQCSIRRSEEDSGVDNNALFQGCF
jgi:hypothetical protein